MTSNKKLKLEALIILLGTLLFGGMIGFFASLIIEK